MTQLHWLWQNLKANFQLVGHWIANTMTIGKLAALTPLVVGGWLIVQELQNDLIAIEPIAVPKALSEIGYTPEVAGSRLRDALNTYAGAPAQGEDGAGLNRNLDSVAHDDDSLNSNFDLNIPADRELPDIVVPQIGLSLRAIASSIRSALGMTGHAISGELTRRDDKYALRLRIDGRQVSGHDYEAENPDELMTKAAPDVMEAIRPAAHAIAQYREQKKEEALLRADEIIAHYVESDINVQWAYLLKGNHALGQKDYKEADKMFSKAVSSNRKSEQPHMQLGVSLLRQGKPDEAIDKFQDVLAINPKSATAHNNIGVARAAQANRGDAGTDQDRLEQAIKAYRQAIATEPGYVIPYNNLGLAYYYRDKVDDAIKQYRAAIGITPNYLLARWNLAFALKKGNFDESVNEYRMAVTLSKDPRQRAMLHTFLGDLFNDSGPNTNVTAAILEYQNAIEIDCYGWAHHNLGQIWKSQGKNDDAVIEFEKAKICDPKDVSLSKAVEQALLPQQASASTTGQAHR